MLRFIFPAILVSLAIGLFLLVTNPMYKEVKELQVKEAAFGQALANAKQLEEKRDELVAKYNEFSPDQIEHLRKLLPDNVDNIRLILEIDSVAAKYGMSLTNVSVSPTLKNDANGKPVDEGGAALALQNQEYGLFDMSFSVQTSYGNFYTFLKDIEQGLRIVDMQGISFDATGNNDKDLYTFNFKIRTYWLKN
jgi:Tfp pilus assembly protein PilO